MSKTLHTSSSTTKKTTAVMPKIKGAFASLTAKQRALALTIIVGIVVGSGVFVARSKQVGVTYETEVAKQGTLISSIAASGTITSGNFTNITTKVSGTVSQVFVDNGDVVQKGQKIAQVTLDEYGKQRQTAAWVSYLEAKEAALEAKSAKSGADIEMWKQRQAILDAQEMVDRMNRGEGDAKTGLAYTENERSIITKNLDQAKLAFDVAQAQYLNADADISSSYANIASAYRDYLENSAIIIAPDAGVVSDLALAEGLQVSASVTTNTSNGSTIVSAQTVGKLNNRNGQLVATVSLTEVDITSIKANQKATLTLDAYPENSFTGSVLAVNTSGSIASGVTSYPVTILLDSVEFDIYQNMAVNAEIITEIKPDVLMVPAAALQTTDETSSVQVMRDGIVSTVAVTVGSSNDTHAEILSGLSAGDVVVTATINPAASSNTSSSTTSPFSGVGRGGAGGFGGAGGRAPGF